jgi:hypothetical protein
MSVKVTSDWKYRDLRVLVIENESIRAVVLPELGGKLWQLACTRTGRDLLWHNPRLAARAVPFGATYDDVFFGGWDELFPNDIPETLAGEPFPDHGELWASPWDWEIRQAGDEARIALRTIGPISGCTIEKTLVVRAGDAHLSVRHRLTNTGRDELPYLWKQHVAVPVAEPARIGLGAATMYVEDFGTPRAGGPGHIYEWPRLVGADGTATDMSRTLPASSGVSEFQYATHLDGGWCAVTYEDGSGLGLAFDPEVFRSCWLFASYGGWRGLEVLILELCTGHPVSVAAGVERGTHQILLPGGVIETTVTAVAYTGMAEVSGVAADGTVRGVRR